MTRVLLSTVLQLIDLVQFCRWQRRGPSGDPNAVGFLWSCVSRRGPLGRPRCRFLAIPVLIFMALFRIVRLTSPWSQRHQTITDSFAARLSPSLLDRARSPGLWTLLGPKRFRCEEVLSQPSFSQNACIFCKLAVIKGETRPSCLNI